ncbi:hypothetical protein KIS1582_0336 [Cytobacillus firmus]|uniref:Uncharacterized protein n=1 Tax=Cytobacillus firmus TaxID=1399 RepID=A0A800NFF8_CYTFI|nr:hypothetical protein KIS1582_0336 [Cytobacillus firmus]
MNFISLGIVYQNLILYVFVQKLATNTNIFWYLVYNIIVNLKKSSYNNDKRIEKKGGCPDVPFSFWIQICN